MTNYKRRQELFSVKLRKPDFTKNTNYVYTVPFDQYCSNVYRSYCYGKKLYYSSSITASSSSSTTTTKSKFSTTSLSSISSSSSSSNTVTSGRQDEGGRGFFHMMSKISSVNEFIYQGLENSIQLELGTLQQDVMRSRASSLSTILTSSNIRRDDDDDVIGRDKHNNKRINENTVLTYISSSKTLLSFYCIFV